MPTIYLSGDGDTESEEISHEIDLVIKKRVDDISIHYIQNLDGFTKGKVRETVHNIPDTVGDAYEKILSKGKDQLTAKRLFHIILAANRPLSVEELSLAMALKSEDQSHDDILESIEPAERFKSTLRNICGLMLVIVDNEVYLLHQTIKEYMVQKFSEAVDSVSSSS
ncbi:hypothetical protein N7507_003897 [Penicillium longicatenatum]|nr:hypothetical protein N7507_003897 [Penicillium longicatenatum]